MVAPNDVVFQCVTFSNRVFRVSLALEFKKKLENDNKLMANYVGVIQREVEVNQNPVFIGMEIIQKMDSPTIVLSSDDECTTRTGVPEKKAKVIISHESPMKPNVSKVRILRYLKWYVHLIRKLHRSLPVHHPMTEGDQIEVTEDQSGTLEDLVPGLQKRLEREAGTVDGQEAPRRSLSSSHSSSLSCSLSSSHSSSQGRSLNLRTWNLISWIRKKCPSHPLGNA
ncbi:hypothetical protein DAPPUDRAFT_245559 [Daphnia pulex]|uniref:Uncharacterized protein n=1 Tax=Daphnia pulex TaxID=6669 RepID=E9GNL4_DAPPU|nr:hypothetical protein DAPPUDRAFT_245559 [Daphnia pulex]|eukprot:EFX78942.1 hypothetical protein DAPPUDRAFT_245559 [Daphnia pulex]